MKTVQTIKQRFSRAIRSPRLKPRAMCIRAGLFAAVILAVVPTVIGAIYTATVLYQLTGFGPISVEWATSGKVVGYQAGGGNNHALLWTNNGASVDLNPAGFTSSIAYGTNGIQQVGFGLPAGGNTYHALLWTGNAASVVDLGSVGAFYSSFAYGTNGTQQVGYGTTPYNNHALLWTGTAASAVDLNPSGSADSTAYAISGNQQVGVAAPVGRANHAMLWSGTAASAVDLNPSGFSDSIALGINGAQQVGYGSNQATFQREALLWSGTAASAVDLNPSAFNLSMAYGSNGSQQVGYGRSISDNLDRALLWSGTAASVVDLSAQLPVPENWYRSYAYSIDPLGNVFGYASGAYKSGYGDFAVEWSPVAVPEPASATLLVLGAAMIFAYRKHHRRN